MHYDKNANRWKILWEDKRTHVVNVEYPEDNGKLFVTYLEDKWKPETETELFQLKWGVTLVQ